jgi:hypothetical protein
MLLQTSDRVSLTESAVRKSLPEGSKDSFKLSGLGYCETILLMPSATPDSDLERFFF